MQILVDADACPVKGIILKVAKKYAIPVIMLFDNSHVYDDGYSKVIIVDKGRDSVDICLINLLKKGDIVITQDFGVAAMALGRQAFALNQNGMVYSEDNMDKLLFERFLGQKVRRMGGKTKGYAKRTKEQDEAFYEAFLKLVKKRMKDE